jgi:ABC-2 type transport system ATP-binding protein
MAIIKVEELVRRRGDVLAVDGISFSVQAGCIFGLLGPNGAGKTSTIEVLEGLDQPTAGSVQVLGHDVTTDAAEIKERIGVQLQTTGLPRYLNPYETLDLFASFYKGRPSDRVAPLLTRMGLDGVRRRLNSRLSGGERQRLALALALVNDPDILFLDEPSSGLDPAGRLELWAVIREWQSGGKTVFLTTHDMHEAERLCDEIAIMDEGRIVAQGSVASLIQSEEAEQAIWVEAEFPSENGTTHWVDLGATLAGVSRTLPDGNGVLVYTTDAMATMSNLLDLRHRGEISFASFELRTPSLEDVFLRRTGKRLEE